MNREDIIAMAQEAGLAFDSEEFPEIWQTYMYVGREEIERFAALVAKHTLANIDPSSFMSWQEGYEAGKQTEREACAKVCEELKITGLMLDAYSCNDARYKCAEAIRARGRA